MKPTAADLPDQAGVTLMEFGVAALLGVVLVALASFFFTSQVRGYADVRAQADMQTQAKKATQEMIREISNAGAMMTDASRAGFSIAPTELRIVYLDVRRRYCPLATDSVHMTFRVKPGGARGDTLVKVVSCNQLAPTTLTLVRNGGPIALAFQYFDAANATTSDATRVQRVRFSLDVKTRARKGNSQKGRVPQVDVALVNY